jgi:nucleoside-diphosphate-sugar epimerase
VRALVTGGAGFIGRHMIRALLARGYDVHSIDLAPTDATGDRAGAGRLYAVEDDAHELFRHGWNRFDLVVHAAAVEPHRAAIDTRPNHLAANLHLDAAMFEWAARTRQRRVLYLSSSAAYPTRLQTGDPLYRLRESDIDPACDRIQPDAGYGWAKLTGERMAADAAKAGLAVHIVRPFSGYGEDQDERWPFGAFVARARRREDPFVIWGNGTQVRDWLHVDDLVAAALAVVDADERRPVNLCTGVGTSMFELAYACCRAIGHGTVTILPRPQMPSGVPYRVGNPARMAEHYQPKIGLEEGVRRGFA